MIVDCAAYRNGMREHESEDPRQAREHAGRDGFVWIGLYEPSPEEFDLITKEYGLHPLAVEDAVHAHQRPKQERYDDTLFVVIKTLRYLDETSDIETGELMVFLGERFVVTVRHGEANPLAGVRRRCERHPELLRPGPIGVLYAVLDDIVDTYELIAREVEADIIQLERRVFSPGRTNDAAAIYSLKREAVEFRGAVQPLIPVVRRFAADDVHEVIRPYFRDVADHVLRVAGTIDSHNELLTSVLNANMAQVSVRMNEDMRKISAWAAIIAVPTMIAGIYGMNFRHMPELRWVFAYPLVLAVMAIACLVVHRLFRRSGWL